MTNSTTSSPPTSQSLASNSQGTATPTTTTSSTTMSPTMSSTISQSASSTSPSVTTPSSNLSTTFMDTKHGKSTDFHITSGGALTIFLVISLLLAVGGFILIYFRKKGKLPCKPSKSWLPLRKRRSSTSSQGPLTQTDSTSVSTCEPPPRPEREFFSIGDQDGGEDGRANSSRARRDTREDDYFYDEMFERSAFVDEKTSRANKHLTVDDDEEDVLASFNIPDLIFKKPMKRV